MFVTEDRRAVKTNPPASSTLSEMSSVLILKFGKKTFNFLLTENSATSFSKFIANVDNSNRNWILILFLPTENLRVVHEDIISLWRNGINDFLTSIHKSKIKLEKGGVKQYVIYEGLASNVTLNAFSELVAKACRFRTGFYIVIYLESSGSSSPDSSGSLLGGLDGKMLVILKEVFFRRASPSSAFKLFADGRL